MGREGNCMETNYVDREQTAAKHLILRKYLQTLSFKLLNGGFPALTYVDGFSGPWEAQSDNYSDTSFMIALGVLKDAQQNVRAATGITKTIRCFFVEQKKSSYTLLHAAVMKHHDPANSFFVHTFHGRFEDAVDTAMKIVGDSFALTFIDPTGWTGYEFEKIAPIMAHKPGEILLNFMSSFINRFVQWDDPKNVATFNGIFGSGWGVRLNAALPRDQQIQGLFSEQFQRSGKFSHVLFTPIEKLSDQTHFCLVYGTRNASGLEAYRDVEYVAMKEHGLRRDQARQLKSENKSGQKNLFSAAELQTTAPIDSQIVEFREQAKIWLREELVRNGRAFPFSQVWEAMIDTFMLRKTEAKKVCVEMAREGIIKETWRQDGSRRKTPAEVDLIDLC
jgi:three-Cys-motif partner protein